MQKPDYRLFKRKIYGKIALIAAIALFSVFILRIMVSGWMGDLIVLVLQSVFRMTERGAHQFYFYFIRSNLGIIVFATVAAFFVVLSSALLSQFTKYFQEISDGLDTLVEDRDSEIKLSPEMASMESKLKAIKQTLEQREQEAKSAEQRKNDLVMYLAHDIKTPLTSVIGYLSLLDEAPDMPPEQKAKYVNITLEKALRLEGLIDEFFEITRYNFQGTALSREHVDLYYMLAQMTDEFYPLISAKGKQISLHVPEDLAIYGDPDKLARVFNNILKNAVAYSEDNSIIDIGVTLSGERVSIAFTNRGSIPKEKLASIFDKFYRLDSSRSSDTGGAGLGLAIAKEIVIEHGGSIYADSDDEHTTFTVEIPTVIERP